MLLQPHHNPDAVEGHADVPHPALGPHGFMQNRPHEGICEGFGRRHA